MQAFLARFLMRFFGWWIPLAMPWCLLFLGVGSVEELELWLADFPFRRAYRSLVAGLMFALPAAVFAAIAHTAILYRGTIYSAPAKSGLVRQQPEARAGSLPAGRGPRREIPLGNS